ncbi:methyltransferase domain-containing protein [uncultured Jatrophihabitans sp.]|uniref:methyltransferase domain-containing protein n=1 Tax=uncultured Jatrophihabitans sp. TaxID=1610747 RepID=UPI0035CC3F93
MVRVAQRVVRVAQRVVRRAQRDASTATSRLLDPLRRPLPASPLGVAEVVDGARLVGTVTVPPGAPAGEVAVYLNSTEIVRLPLIPTTGEPGTHEFRFKIRPLLRFARRTDRLTVRYDGAALPFAGDGTVHRPAQHGRLPTWQLRRRLARGEIFSSDGILQKPKHLDVEWQQGVLGLYSRVREALHDIAGYDAFLIYGSLLGAVRDGGFIGHDTDLDAGYISKHPAGADAGRELAEIGLALVERGFRVECRVVTLHIYDLAADGAHIDLFHTFFDDEGVLRFSWGVAGITDYRREHWTGAHEIDFAGARALVPSEPEVMVAAMYGPGWRTPDPGFSWARDRTKREPSARVPAKLNTAVNWADLHARAELGQTSPFARWCLQEPGLPRVVLDLGCGDGRDSVAFAAAGHAVVGLDAAATAIRRAESRPGAGGVRFRVLDFDDTAALRAEITAARGGGEAVLFYGRQLLDSLHDDTAAALLDTLFDLAADADMIAFASRTTAPEKSPLRHRRPVDGAELERELTARGFTVLRAESTDFPASKATHQVIARRAAEAVAP